MGYLMPKFDSFVNLIILMTILSFFNRYFFEYIFSQLHSINYFYLACFFTAVWIPDMDANKTYGEKAWWQLHKNAESNIEQILEAAPHKAAAVRPFTTHHKNSPS